MCFDVVIKGCFPIKFVKCILSIHQQYYLSIRTPDASYELQLLYLLSCLYKFGGSRCFCNFLFDDSYQQFADKSSLIPSRSPTILFNCEWYLHWNIFLVIDVVSELAYGDAIERNNVDFHCHLVGEFRLRAERVWCNQSLRAGGSI